MPEYLRPGVYVEETTFRSRPLEGASTSTTAFVGTTRRGPVTSQRNLLTTDEQELMTPELITSVGDFERLYGSTADLQTGRNYLAHAVRGFFANGGRRLYVARIMELSVGTQEARAVQVDGDGADDWLVDAGGDGSARFEARFPGTAGNGRVYATQNAAPASGRSLERAPAGTMVRVTGAGTEATVATVTSTVPAEPYPIAADATLDITVGDNPTVNIVFTAENVTAGAALYSEIQAVLDSAGLVGLDPLPESAPLELTTSDSGSTASITLAGTALDALGLTAGTTEGTNATPPLVTYHVKQGADADATWIDASDNDDTIADLQAAGTVEFLTFSIEVEDADRYSQVFEGLGLSNLHPRYIDNVLGAMPTRRVEQLENIVALAFVGDGPTAFALRDGLTTGADASGRATFLLDGGTDGAEPTAQRFLEGLEALEGIDGISIIAAPGSSAMAAAEDVRNGLIADAERPGAYRIAVLDGPDNQTVGQIRNVRASMDSDHAALYHPWIIIPNPDARPGDLSRPVELAVPPSGHICGIYARNDAERGVHKAPANEVVMGAKRFESNVTNGEQEVLNPEGINVLRSFRGRGHRVWGGRLASSDPLTRYVNVRRYFNYVASTLDRGTQWVVFEPNNEKLWERVTATVTDFLYNEWVNGALLGRSRDDAFFARCGHSTMTQSDIDNGRLICEVGMAIVFPAEFVIFRIGQKTATSNS